MHAFIREELVRQFGDAGQTVRILYGGSVKAGQCRVLAGGAERRRRAGRRRQSECARSFWRLPAPPRPSKRRGAATVSSCAPSPGSCESPAR